nr:hypothetical protein [Candidatus Sigynarchaeota archaeon]
MISTSDDNKNAIIWILVLIIIVLLVVSFINPAFYFDDIVYYGIIIFDVVLLVTCASGKDLRDIFNFPASERRIRRSMPRPHSARPETSRSMLVLGKNGSESSVENTVFHPPFDELFKDQATIKTMFSQFIDWVAVQRALKRWVDSILVRAQALADERRDAWAKWEAWQQFEHDGFLDPRDLPAWYVKKVQEATRLEAESREKEASQPVCPHCGASGANVVPLSVSSSGNVKKEYSCKSCGMVF